MLFYTSINDIWKSRERGRVEVKMLEDGGALVSSLSVGRAHYSENLSIGELSNAC